MKLELESLLQVKVDLLSDKGMSKYIRPYIEHDKKLIYEKMLDDKARLQHILDAILEIEEYMTTHTEADFSATRCCLLHVYPPAGGNR